MDITLAFLPWEILRHLTMDRKEKTAVMLARSMGVLYDLHTYLSGSESCQ